MKIILLFSIALALSLPLRAQQTDAPAPPAPPNSVSIFVTYAMETGTPNAAHVGPIGVCGYVMISAQQCTVAGVNERLWMPTGKLVSVAGAQNVVAEFLVSQSNTPISYEPPQTIAQATHDLGTYASYNK